MINKERIYFSYKRKKNKEIFNEKHIFYMKDVKKADASINSSYKFNKIVRIHFSLV